MPDTAYRVESRPSPIGYASAQEVFNEHPLRSHEIPLEDYVSLAAPTRRWGQPAWVWFSSPSDGDSHGVKVYPPNRLWAFSALGGSLQVYATGELARQLLGQEPDASAPKSLPPIAETIPEIQRLLHGYGQALDVVSEPFFTQRAATAEQRDTARQAVKRAIPGALLPIYSELAPDWFAWLDS